MKHIKPVSSKWVDLTTDGGFDLDFVIASFEFLLSVMTALQTKKVATEG